MAQGVFDQSEVGGVGEGEQLPEPLPADPFPLVAEWYAEAQRRKLQPNPNAMALATVDGDGRPSVRIVLCKGLDPKHGSLVFFTNYQSRKGASLDARPGAAVVFHWDALDRQVRIEGSVARVSAEESDAYFATRSWESRIGAWSSDQSKPIASRAAMRARVEETMGRFGLDPDHPPAPGSSVTIPRPPHWGGYRLLADRVELWASGKGRLHDRAAWDRSVTGSGSDAECGPWRSTRIQP